MDIAKQKIRVRFAPSPTGFLHIGGLRTALYNFLFARKNHGTMILRIEDTDRTRYVEGGIENIIQSLQNYGIEYDEGPFLQKNEKTGQIEIIEKGNYGPYIQSKRLEIYRKFAFELVEKKKAYFCFCTPERLEALRQEQMAKKQPTMYDGLCKKKSEEEIKHLLAQNTPYVIRLNVPDEGVTTFKDLIHHEISIKNVLIDDQVLLKSDGFPTYHLANVVDDHLMEISHVIRGEEWLSSTPKHILLYNAFGWQPPIFAHLPLLLNPDRTKLSKRHGDVAVEEYFKKGYLKEALINFIALLGWNPKSDQEIYSLEELINFFELKNINKNGAIVNFEKLDWLNGYYIRKKNLDELTKLCLPYLVKENLLRPANENEYFICKKYPEKISFNQLKRIIALEQERLKKLSDIAYATEFFFVDKLHYEPEILKWKPEITYSNIVRRLEILKQKFEEISDDDWEQNIEPVTRKIIEENQFANGEVLWPFRVAVSGRLASPSQFEIAKILGKKETIQRINYAIELAKKQKED